GRVTTINPIRHSIQLQNGQQIGYKKILLATGGRPNRLNCPGLQLAGVTTLRSVADYKEVLRQLESASHVVVYGSGTLALESAEVLNQRGYQVTHLMRSPVLWSEVLDTTASDLVLQEAKRSGIEVRTEEEISEIIGKDGHVTHVLTSTGSRIRCDLLLIAIGIEPNIGFIRASGILCGRGVKVDHEQRTNVSDIYAAGDVTETMDPRTGKIRVIGQWYPAVQQARIAAYSMLDRLDQNQPCNSTTFYNASFLHGLEFAAIGQTTRLPHANYAQEIIAEPRPRSYRKVLLKDGIAIGALFLGERKHALAFKRAIDARVNLSPVVKRLFADDFDLDAWLDQQDAPEAEVFLDTDIVEAHTRQLATTTGREPQFGTALGYLVPIPHPKVIVSVTEMQLSQQGQWQLIGRRADAAIHVEHSSVSRRHAEILYEEGVYQLRDCGSANGTFINNVVLVPNALRILRHNDLLRFGDVQFRFLLRPQLLNQGKQDGQQTSSTTSLLHLNSSQLHANATRIIPESVLASLPGSPTLVLVMQNAQPRIVHLEMGQRYTLGRDKQNSIVLDDSATSRRHAEIFTAPDGFYVRDLKSSYGVFVNSLKIHNAYHLSHGDRIVVGNTLIYCSLPYMLPIEEPPIQQTTQLLAVPTRSNHPLRSTASERFEASEDTSRQPALVGVEHRSNIRPFSEKRVQFEVDMCIGCNRCMEACPIPMSSLIRISELNQATTTDTISPRVERFTHECIMCGSCVPVCPVDDHRDLLMLSLKQRIGVTWDGPIDKDRIEEVLPLDWTIAQLISRLREQPIFSNTKLVPENYLLHLFAASQIISLEASVTLLREGEYGRDIYFILDGRVALSTAGIDEQGFASAILGRGEYVGEYGMLTGQPHNSTARTQTPALVLQVPEQVMQRFLQLVPKAQHYFERLSNARFIESILKRMALFQGVTDADIRTLVEQTQVKQYNRDERLFAENDQTGSIRPARETLHVLLEGFVKVARLTMAGTGRNKSNERIIAYRQGGDYFAGGLDLLGDGRAVTVTAITRTRVAEVPRTAMLALFQRYPEVKQRFTLRLKEYIASTANAYSAIFDGENAEPLMQPVQSTPEVRAGLHTLVDEGIVEGTEVLVIDLDKCIHCNECEEACARRHGHSRMNRKGMIVGNISIATTCRQCQDPVCMLCSRAGIARMPNGEVYITESCIGCGICAQRCPYGAISIVNVEDETAGAQEPVKRFNSVFGKNTDKKRERKYLPMANGKNTLSLSKTVTSGPLSPAPLDGYDEIRKKVAIKCDLCAGYKDQACVEACPSGAAIRVQPVKFFGSTEQILKRRKV
ncbi:MAG TPA: FAD-dependent oxidoreductase, partial [Ktedonobacteraceae bacterium]|nr:FAD-dependent oxidoreductase [Ktedonobacteraceae bacterium]